MRIHHGVGAPVPYHRVQLEGGCLPDAKKTFSGPPLCGLRTCASLPRSMPKPAGKYRVILYLKYYDDTSL
jgi:hypothetical protein